MKNRNICNHDNWATPPDFYQELNQELNFDFDPCPWNHDPILDGWDGLDTDWGDRNFVNPPYSAKLKKQFVEKAISEKMKGKKSVLLLPVSTSTILFHDFIQPNMSEPIKFVRRRLRFIGVNTKGQHVNHDQIMEVDYTETIPYDGGLIPKYVKNSGMHDSMLVVF